MPPVVGQFTSIRQQLADVLRDYHPDQPRDGRGRFASGGGGKQEKAAPSEHHHGFEWAQGPFHAASNLNEHTMTHEQLALVLSKLNPDGATNICGGCGKITNGPHAGFVLGIQPTLSGKHINDTYCPDCMYHHLFAAYRNMGRTDQNAHALSLWIMQHAFSPDTIRQLGVHVDDLLSAVPPPSGQKPIYKDEQRSQQLHRLTAQLSAIRLQLAQVMRGEEWVDAHGNVWIIERGAHGYFQGMYLVSAASGAGHVTLPSGAKAHVGGKGQVSVHEAARMLREKMAKEGNPQKEEVKPGGTLEPRQRVVGKEFDITAPMDIPFIHQVYESDQLGAALHRYTLKQLQTGIETYNVAHPDNPISTKGIRNNHAALVTAIVAHVTRDEATGIPRYSGDFGKSASGEKAQGDATSKATPADHPDLEPYRQALASLRERYAGLLAARPDVAKAHAAAEKAASGGKVSGKTRPEFETHLKSALNDAKVTDPLQAWQAFGGNKASVQAVLETESPGRLMLLLRDPKMPPGPEPRAQTSKALAKTIAERLDRHFNGEQSSGAKTAGAGKKLDLSSILNDGLVPVRQGINYDFNPTRPPDPRFLRTLYGDAQLRKALARYDGQRLVDMAREYKIDIPSKGSREPAKAYRERLLDIIEQWTIAQPTKTLSDESQRATIPTLAAIRATLRSIA